MHGLIQVETRSRGIEVGSSWCYRLIVSAEGAVIHVIQQYCPKRGVGSPRCMERFMNPQIINEFFLDLRKAFEIRALKIIS